MAEQQRPGGPPAPDSAHAGGDDPLAGTPFRAVNLLSRGVRSRVYCAQHRSLGQLAAVKLVQPLQRHAAQARDRVHIEAQTRDRVRIEAQVGARLRHPNLVAVHDFGATDAGLPFLAMDLLHGESLAERLATDRPPLPLHRALDIGCQLLDGLALVHRSGLIHRDIKPHNVFICASGVVKLLDLGFAKVVEQVCALTPDRLIETTDTDVQIGSPRYMAPEQASHHPVDARADLYAVGGVLYRMLCGRGPFDEATDARQLLAAHLKQPPQPLSHHRQAPLPTGLEALVLQCLEKAPDQRPASATALRLALAALARSSGGHR